MVRIHHDQDPPRSGSTTIRIHHDQDPSRSGSTTIRIHHDQDPPRSGSITIRIHHDQDPSRSGSTTIRIHHDQDPPSRSRSLENLLNTAGDCSGQTGSQRQEHVGNIHGSSSSSWDLCVLPVSRPSRVRNLINTSTRSLGSFHTLSCCLLTNSRVMSENVSWVWVTSEEGQRHVPGAELCCVCSVQLLWSWRGCRRRNHHPGHSVQRGAAHAQHRATSPHRHGNPAAEADAVQVWFFSSKLCEGEELSKFCCRAGELRRDVGSRWFEMLHDGFTGTRVTLAPLWLLEEWMWLELTCTVFTLTAPMTSCLSSPWVRVLCLLELSLLFLMTKITQVHSEPGF